MPTNAAPPLSERAQTAINGMLVRAVETLDDVGVQHWLSKGASATLLRTLPSAVPGKAPSAETLMDVAWWSVVMKPAEERTEALMARSEKVIRLLVEHGGDPNACHWHVWLNSPNLFLTFIRAGVNLNGDEGMDYRHPLVWWYAHHHRPIDPDILDAMLDHGMDIHRCVDGHPLLAHCLGGNDTAAAERLLRAGARTDGFLLPLEKTVGVYGAHNDPERTVKAQATLTWWIAHEKAALEQALSPGVGGPASGPAERSVARPRERL